MEATLITNLQESMNMLSNNLGCNTGTYKILPTNLVYGYDYPPFKSIKYSFYAKWNWRLYLGCVRGGIITDNIYVVSTDRG